MNIKPSWDSTPDMFEGGIPIAINHKQQRTLDEVINGASDSFIAPHIQKPLAIASQSFLVLFESHKLGLQRFHL